MKQPTLRKRGQNIYVGKDLKRWAMTRAGYKILKIESSSRIKVFDNSYTLIQYGIWRQNFRIMTFKFNFGIRH